ncbi:MULTISPECIES: DUF6957 family protein [Pseudomonas]|uniref:DUF6957 family protein n=1 Tax=Pseudomonas TaxID=286 RepID=UPI001EE91ACA|nr:hypothetical protein [Pseudomonas putida]
MHRIEKLQDEQLVSDLLYGQAQPMGGSNLDDARLIQIAEAEFAGRAFCIVRNWMVLDIMLPAEELGELTAAGRYPMVLIAHDVAYDSDVTKQYQAPLATDYGQEFYGCFFKVGAKMFVLAGRGARRYAAKPAWEALKQTMAEQRARGST